MTKPDARQKAEEMMLSGKFSCSEAVFLVANDYLGRPVPDEMMRLASGFAVGIGKAGCVCGALSGGVMALGIKYGRTRGGEKTSELFEATKELHNRFVARHKCTCCRILTKPFRAGSSDHLTQCATITGEVAADVIELLKAG